MFKNRLQSTVAAVLYWLTLPALKAGDDVVR